MSGAIPPLPHYVSMAWCSVKSTGTTLPLPLPFIISFGKQFHDLSFYTSSYLLCCSDSVNSVTCNILDTVLIS